MKAIKLKNGTEEADVLVNAVMMNLQSLHRDVAGVTLFYDLVMRCRDSSSEMWDSQLQRLKDRSLLQQDGQPHQSIKNIIESAVVGDELQMQLQNPVLTNNDPLGTSPFGDGKCRRDKALSEMWRNEVRGLL